MNLGKSISVSICNDLWYFVYGNLKDELEQLGLEHRYLVQPKTRDFVEDMIDEIAYCDIR